MIVQRAQFWLGLTIILAANAALAEENIAARFVLDEAAGATFRFGGPIGQRIDANVRHWLLRAPAANPALVDMFALRDRQPPPELVDWAGEFVGKYLISAAQAARMSDDPELRTVVAGVVERLLAAQADDGYLGPWPQRERLLGHWDLWGHYHVMQGLLLWGDLTGDGRCRAAAVKAADLVCKTYLGGSRRVFDAGSHEMNMSVIHVMALLYQRTGEPRYLEMCRAIVADFERAGDYLRTGVAGVEYFKTPRPRWESLHAVQGLAEMYRITGDARFRTALLSHRASIRRLDMRNSGGFSSGEQATGNPFADSAIETCCTIAWSALMIDALRLSGDSAIADDLELALYNAIAAAQHPSGSWWTYDTPMNGRRTASQHSIVFQARPGSPELNCCSVNGPRGLGMLSQWAVMQSPGRVALNYLGPMTAKLRVDDSPLQLKVEGVYPVELDATVSLAADAPVRLKLLVRIPNWAAGTTAALNGQAIVGVTPGRYLEVDRTWLPSDRLSLKVALPVWYESGDLEQAGRISAYCGPLLMAYDQRFNSFDEAAIPTLSPAKLAEARPVVEAVRPNVHLPWLLLQAKGEDGRSLTLVDFASAGSGGTRYRSWLPARDIRPPRPAPLAPADGQHVARGPIRFTWRKPAGGERHAVLIGESPALDKIVLRFGDASGESLELPADEASKLKPGAAYYWKIAATNAAGESLSIGPAKSFVVEGAK